MNTTTNTEQPRDIIFIAKKVIAYQDHLLDQYETYYLKNSRKYKGNEKANIDQLILGLTFPKIRCGYSRDLDSYNYCKLCKKFKSKNNGTNKFCQEHYNNTSECWSTYNHMNNFLCYKCLRKCVRYDEHHDKKYKSKCPFCNMRSKFHFIDHTDLTKSKISRTYLIKNILDFTSTTTLKLNYKFSKFDTHRSKHDHFIQNKKNWKHNIVYNTNSYSWKFSLLNRILLVQRWIYTDLTEARIYKGDDPVVKYFSMRLSRDDMRHVINRIKEGIIDGHGGNQENNKFSYLYDDEELNFRDFTLSPLIDPNNTK